MNSTEEREELQLALTVQTKKGVRSAMKASFTSV